MPLKITVERVSASPQRLNFKKENYSVISDQLPFSVVLADNNTEGVNVQLLKAFLNLASEGELTTVSSGTGATDTIRALIIAQHTALVDV